MQTNSREYKVGNLTYFWRVECATLVLDETAFTVTLWVSGQAPVLLFTGTNLAEAQAVITELR